MPTPTFKLTVDSLELTLVEFDGIEEMNRLFKYTFTTEIPSTGEKLVDVIDGDAIFTIVEYDTSLHTGDIEIPGYISKASKTSSEWILEFQPKLKKTTTNSRSEIYFKEDASLDALAVIQLEFDHDIALSDRTPIFDITSTLPTRKLFCQFHESNLNFVARVCDHWGFHFYFDHFSSQLVFADNNQYDQKFTTQLKTTNTTSDSSPLKIRNWQENLIPVESYTTVLGYDHENAGTSITASYPAGSSLQNGLTEAQQTLSDVNSQEEAEYIAQIRQEAANCLNHLASGETQIPYIMPGLLIDTDDSDFTQAFVIKTVNTARNLNSTNSGVAPNFTCEFQAIPDSTCFRPARHYAIPIATNVVGKVISETDDITQAQRNTAGYYKAELLGFENESSLHPWLRKAQTTAGSNSVDVPLTPNTEVLISFVDNNPNCPYIQHALDNSLSPVPVTSANPYHAVVATNGTLVTSSLLGRQNYSTTKTHIGVSDSTISGSIKNYFNDRGDFSQHTAFIDPSSTTTTTFTKDEEASGDYIFTRHYGDSVEIREGDKLHWHNGNLYDFGGYWNYNLGNSYVENYLDQASAINQKITPYTAADEKDILSLDLLELGGPSFNSVIWPNISGKVDLTGGEYPFPLSDTNKTPSASDSTQPFHKNNMNVEKTFKANSYEFSSECNAIDISDRCSSLEITHTDASTYSVEMGFHKGNLRSWEQTIGRGSKSKSWAGNGNQTSDNSSSTETESVPNPFNPTEITDVYTKTVKEKDWNIDGTEVISDSTKIIKKGSTHTDEKSYNMATGALATHSIVKSDGMGSNVMDFSYQEVNKAEFNFGGERKFGISATGTASLAISLSGAIDISIEASLKLDMKANASLTIEIEADAAGKIELNNGKFEYSVTGLLTKVAPSVEARMKTLGLTQKVTDIEKLAIRLDDAEMKLQSHKIAIRAGGVIMDGL